MNKSNLIIDVIFGGAGLILFIIGVLLMYNHKKKQKRCIFATEGQVVDYSFIHKAPEPIVQYTINGVTYKKARRFNAVITSTRGGLSLKSLNPNNYDIYVDENDNIHIKRGAIMNLKKAAKELYPLGSTLRVFYDPEKPKSAYVERIPGGTSIAGIVFMGTGALVVLAAGIIELLLG